MAPRKKGKSRIKKNFWDESTVKAAMQTYRNSFTVTNTANGGGKLNTVKVELIDPSAANVRAMEVLYSEAIYPSHLALAKAYLNYKRVAPEHISRMTEDIVSYMYEVLIKYWDPASTSSSYSYFAYSCGTMIAHYFNGKLASSPLWASEKLISQELERVRISGELDEEIENLTKIMLDRGMEEGSFIVKKFGGKDVIAIETNKTVTEFMDEKSDVAMADALDHWGQIDLKTLSEYIPDVVIAKMFHELAFAVLEIVEEILSLQLEKGPCQRIDFWLLSTLQSRVGWSVTLSDMKMSFFTLRKAMEYYLEDFPLEVDQEIGTNGYISYSEIDF